MINHPVRDLLHRRQLEYELSAIATGTYQPGDQLPTLADLTARYGIAVMTARDAIRQLVADGLVVS